MGHPVYYFWQPFLARPSGSLSLYPFPFCHSGLSSTMPNLSLSLYIPILTSTGGFEVLLLPPFHDLLFFFHYPVRWVKDPLLGINLTSSTRISLLQVSHILDHSSSSPNTNTENQIKFKMYLFCCGTAASPPRLVSIQACSLQFHSSPSLPHCQKPSFFQDTCSLRAPSLGLGSHIASAGDLILVLLS